jgi:hypothetical protein
MPAAASYGLGTSGHTLSGYGGRGSYWSTVSRGRKHSPIIGAAQ